MKKQHLLFCLMGAIALAKIAGADETDFGKKIPTADQVIEALDPNSAKPAKPDDSDYEGDINAGGNGKSRSIDMNPLAANKPKLKSKVTTHNKTRTETALSMDILFAYKSAELTDAGKEQLHPVGEALTSERLQNLEVVVEGYTDAVGGYAYNKSLSEQRASSVKLFLVDTFHIDPSHIQVVGKGKSDLLDPSHPDSEINRRVRIVATK